MSINIDPVTSKNSNFGGYLAGGIPVAARRLSVGIRRLAVRLLSLLMCCWLTGRRGFVPRTAVGSARPLATIAAFRSLPHAAAR